MFFYRHHQVDFIYPPFPNVSNEVEKVPSGYKYLPTLAIPDGSHKFDNDTVYFNLPDLINPKQSIYGISVYRQISVDQLKIVTAEMTRSSVQKSVCALLTIPAYGYIEVKLSLIADMFFEQGDFENTDILVKVYHQLNQCLTSDEVERPLHRVNEGLQLREHFLKWRHKLLVIFKLFLLQKKVVFFSSPVQQTCSLIIAVASLFPRLLTDGFAEVFALDVDRPMSPLPTYQSTGEKSSSPDEDVQLSYTETRRESGDDSYGHQSTTNLSTSESNSSNLQRDNSMDSLTVTAMTPFCSVNPDIWSAPVPIFENGNLCLPYISLPYLDMLQDPSVHSYVIGASNILFKQKRSLADVFIDTETMTIEVQNLELKRMLQLSTEDRRFIDYLTKHVSNPKEGAEGSEQWIREQFSGYLVSLLRTSLTTAGSKDFDSFNNSYMTIFRRTDAYDLWCTRRADTSTEFKSIPIGHPFAGNLSVTDMKLRLTQNLMHNTERGRKINQAVNNTTQAVNQALLTAKSTFSSWLSSIATPTAAEMEATSSVPASYNHETTNTCSSYGEESGIEAEEDDLNLATHDSVSDKDDSGSIIDLNEIIQKTANKIKELASDDDDDDQSCEEANEQQNYRGTSQQNNNVTPANGKSKVFTV